MVQGSYIWDFKYSDRQPRNMPQMQGNALEISLDFQFGPIPAIFFLHTPLPSTSLRVVKQIVKLSRRTSRSHLLLARCYQVTIVGVTLLNVGDV